MLLINDLHLVLDVVSSWVMTETMCQKIVYNFVDWLYMMKHYLPSFLHSSDACTTNKQVPSSQQTSLVLPYQYQNEHWSLIESNCFAVFSDSYYSHKHFLDNYLLLLMTHYLDNNDWSVCNKLSLCPTTQHVMKKVHLVNIHESMRQLPPLMVDVHLIWSLWTSLCQLSNYYSDCYVSTIQSSYNGFIM